MTVVEVIRSGARPAGPAKLGTVVNSAVRITQFYGKNPQNYAKFNLKGHPGIDLIAREGVIITAAHPGKVIEDGDNGDGYGTRVVIWDETQSIKTIYGHLLDEKVRKGATMQEGDLIGHMGSTGNSTGVHLHFGVMRTKSSYEAGNIFGQPFQANEQPLHSDNGYLGWEDPYNDSLFDWYRGGPGFDQGTAEEQLATFMPDAVTPAAKAAPFDSIFATYYAGWDRAGAEQDWIKTMGQDINKLKVARGITDGVKKKREKARPAALLTKIYILNPSFDKMSLVDIAKGIPLGRTDVLAGFLGIQENEKLRGGQELSVNGFPTDYYPSSSEWLGFLKLTGKGKIGKPGDYYIKPEYAGMNLVDIAGKGVSVGRTDILATFLGISEKTVIPGDQGFGLQAFPNSYIPNSSEWIGFNNIFWTTPPATTPEPPELEPTAPSAPKTPATTVIKTGITVNTNPEGARVFIDGLYLKDLTPTNKTYPVTPGPHLIRLEKSGFTPLEFEVIVAENEARNVYIDLKTGKEVMPGGEVVGQLGNAIALAALSERVGRLETQIQELQKK